MPWDGGAKPGHLFLEFRHFLFPLYSVYSQFSGLSSIPCLSGVLLVSFSTLIMFVSSPCNASPPTPAGIYPSCFCLTWPDPLLDNVLVVTCMFPSAPLFVGKTDYFLACSWLSFQIYFSFWPNQTSQCHAAELIVSLFGVPAVDHLLIPPDKLLSKFKDWLLFVLLLGVLAPTAYPFLNQQR